MGDKKTEEEDREFKKLREAQKSYTEQSQIKENEELSWKKEVAYAKSQNYIRPTYNSLLTEFPRELKPIVIVKSAESDSIKTELQGIRQQSTGSRGCLGLEDYGDDSGDI